MPGNTSPFELILSSASIPIQEVDRYALKLTWQNSGTQGTEQQTIQGPRENVSKTEIKCGSIITEMTMLDKDLVCNTDGFIIGSDNVVVNMNGYSISGPGPDGSSVGIMVPSTYNVVINGPGSISNFQAGVLVSEANRMKLLSLTLDGNQIGAFITGSQNIEVQNNTLNQNNLGVSAHLSNGVSITSNGINGSNLAGITLVGTRQSEISHLG